MSEQMGPLAFGTKQEEIFLGREIAQHRDYSENTAQSIDAEVKRLVTEATQKAHDILRINLEKLHTLAKVLLEREILDGEEIDALLNGRALQPPDDEAQNGSAKPVAPEKEPIPHSEPKN
jgi:cell division protease FtsH